MKSLILIDSGKEAALAIKEATEKYSGIFSSELDFIHCKNISEMGNQISAGRKIQIIIINKTLGPEDINLFHSIFSRFKKEPPLLVVTGEQTQLISPKFKKDRVVFNSLMTKDFIFDCLRLYIADENRKMDTRIFREILLSVVDVIYQNTREKLTPKSVGESKASSEIQDVSGVLAFFGEGIKGTLLIGTSSDVMKHLSAKMLYCEMSDLTDEMVDDAMLEISNQVLGIIRNALSGYGYQLNSSMQLVVTGKQHEFQSSSTGHYYNLPFQFNDHEFRVTFCYDTYPVKLNRNTIMEDRSKKRVLDVRLMNDFLSIVPQTIESNTKIPLERLRIDPLLSQSYLTSSLHVVHGRSEEGGFLIALDIPDHTAKKFVQKMLFCDESDVTQPMISDAVGELINQIQGQQKKSSETIGYHFQNIFHCSFTSPESIQYLMKNPGHYCRIEFATDEGDSFITCYGLDSQYAPEFFDVSELLKHSELLNSASGS